MGDKTKPNVTEYKIGSTTYIVNHIFRKDTAEDAATKMTKIMQHEARRLIRQLKTSNATLVN